MSNKGQDYDSLPIPTYEEATSTRSQSSLAAGRGPREISDDAERQGLLGAPRPGNATSGRTGDGLGNYRPPTVESERNSYDNDITEPELDEDAEREDAALRRDMEQMEVEEPNGQSQHQRFRSGFSKRIASLTHTFSSISFPSFSFLTSKLPPLSDYIPRWPILFRLLGLFILLSVIYGIVISRTFSNRAMFFGEQFDPDSVRHFLQSTIDVKRIKANLQDISFDDHMAGTKGSYYLAERIEVDFKAAELDEMFTENYQVYLNYPRGDGRKVAIISPPELAWQAALEENLVMGKEGQHQTPIFHGLSRSGNVTGRLVYANYGSREDFDWLKSQKIDLSGSIVLVRHYGTQYDPALKVKAAELAGAAGCLVYSDPQEDGFLRGGAYPDGRWRPEDSVQRGSVALSNWILGDVLTPGEPSLSGAKRRSKDDNPGLVNIPSLPLAWRDAAPLLSSIQGKGRRVPEAWMGGVPNIDWWTGGSKDAPIVQLMNLQDDIDQQPIRNVIGKIGGYETPEKVVYVGNHRDAWCFGAVNPGSGTAIMLEVVRAFGELMRTGPWRPRRTIVFASWDAGEYNIIGATEHVEDRLQELRDHGIAYLNVDLGVAGDKFRAAASPPISSALLQAMDRVEHPSKNKTMLEDWRDSDSRFTGVGGGGAFAPFQYMGGCSSLDFSFEGEQHSYPYHSCYESFPWVEHFGDSYFEYAASIAQVWALVILEMADKPVIPFDLSVYATQISHFVDELRGEVQRAAPPADAKIDLGGLRQAAAELTKNAEQFMKWSEAWLNRVSQQGMLENRETMIERINHNTRMINFESHLLDIQRTEKAERDYGLPGRAQYKHVLTAPPLWGGYPEDHFPGVVDALRDKDWARAKQQLDIAVDRLNFASARLIN